MEQLSLEQLEQVSGGNSWASNTLGGALGGAIAGAGGGLVGAVLGAIGGGIGGLLTWGGGGGGRNDDFHLISFIHAA